MTYAIAGNVYSPLDPLTKKKLIFTKAKDAVLVEQNGREYLDLINGKGSVTLGHNNERVNLALINSLKEERNIITGPSKIQNDLTDSILKSFDENSEIFYFTTGTEACRGAVAIARKYTKKKIILSAGYHGWDPMWKMNSNLLEANEYGVVNYYYLPELLEEAIMQYENQIALMIFSPDYIFFSSQTTIDLINICKKNNILVCCDDVKQGFRHCRGTSLSLIMKEKIDLYIFGKGLSNGLKLSCVIGNVDIMKAVKNIEYTSFYENSAFIAANENLKIMDETKGYEYITQTVKSVSNILQTEIDRYEIPITIKSFGAVFNFIFGNEKLERIFHEKAIANGIITYERENQNLSQSYDDHYIELLCQRFQLVFESLSELKNIDDYYRIKKDRVLLSGWQSIDGITDQTESKTKIGYLKKMIRLQTMYA